VKVTLIDGDLHDHPVGKAVEVMAETKTASVTLCCCVPVNVTGVCNTEGKLVLRKE
jgi:hypothetical protein